MGKCACRCAGRCAGKCTGKCAGSYPWMTDSSDLLNKYGDQHTWFSNESDESVMPCESRFEVGSIDTQRPAAHFSGRRDSIWWVPL